MPPHAVEAGVQAFGESSGDGFLVFSKEINREVFTLLKVAQQAALPVDTNQDQRWFGGHGSEGIHGQAVGRAVIGAGTYDGDAGGETGTGAAEFRTR